MDVTSHERMTKDDTGEVQTAIYYNIQYSKDRVNHKFIIKAKVTIHKSEANDTSFHLAVSKVSEAGSLTLIEIELWTKGPGSRLLAVSNGRYPL